MQRINVDVDFASSVNQDEKTIEVKCVIKDFQQLWESLAKDGNRSFTIRDYVSKQVNVLYYAKLDKDLKFNVMVQFQKHSVIEFFYCTLKAVTLKRFQVNLSKGIAILARPDYVALDNLTGPSLIDPKVWYPTRCVTNLTKKMFDYVDNNCLSFTIIITIRNDDLKNSELNNVTSSVSEDLLNLIKSSACDITVKSADGTELTAHKLIVSARSAVFKAHFEHGTAESLTNIIETQFETEVLQEVLHYMYNDTAPKVNSMVEKLLAAADYYQLAGLKLICEKELLKNLKIKNAIQTLILANLYSVNHLIISIVNFINENKTAVLDTEDWKNLQSIELLKLLYSGKQP